MAVAREAACIKLERIYQRELLQSQLVLAVLELVLLTTTASVLPQSFTMWGMSGRVVALVGASTSHGVETVALVAAAVFLLREVVAWGFLPLGMTAALERSVVAVVLVVLAAAAREARVVLLT